MKISNNFIEGVMNKTFDERLVPKGQYIDAMNIRLGSTENNDQGAIENTKGNEKLTTLQFNDVDLSVDAICVGSVEDSMINTIYWCVHDPSNPESVSGIVDMIVSYNVVDDSFIYLVISSDDGSGTRTALNFNPTYRVNAMDKIGNLLFINDFYNPPRRFNTNQLYIEPSEVDINVIVKPPSEAPIVNPIKQAGLETYLDTRFISFAYRYKYKDGEYSALSQFSKIAFGPNDFGLDNSGYENTGMTNTYNTAIIFLNTGSSNIVEIDLVFKFSDSTILNVVDKYNKQNLGWSDNSSVSVSFTNKKVYTTLSTDELYRLFDNVPHKAQAQTIMGNRLMYGNYVDGYDLIDENGNSCRMVYTPEVISEEIQIQNIDNIKAESNYTLDAPIDIANSETTILMSEILPELTAGRRLSIEMILSHDQYVTTGTVPLTTSSPIKTSVSIVLSTTYATIAAFVASPEFEAAIGSTTFAPFTDCGTADAGQSLSDQIRCGSVAPFLNYSTWQKFGSGVILPRRHREKPT